MGDVDIVERKLEVRSELPPQEALSRSRRAVESVGRVNLAKPHIVGDSNNGFVVEIKPTSPVGALLDNTSFAVEVTEEAGSSVIRVETTSYSTYQEKVLFFRVGPKSVPGSKVYLRALEAIEKAL